VANAESYRAFVEGLPEDQRAMALAAGLDQPPEDGILRTGLVIRETDGLPLFFKNGAVKAAKLNEPDEDEEPLPPFREDLAEALRAVLGWLLRGVTVEKLFRKPQAVIVRVYALARLLGLNGFADMSVSKAAELAGMTRANLSKAGVEIRDAVGQKFFCAPGDRTQHRELTRRTALRSWEKRREKDLSHLSQTNGNFRSEKGTRGKIQEARRARI
jgi:hypothetical protein